MIDKPHADIVRRAIDIAVRADINDTPSTTLMEVWLEEQPEYRPEVKSCMLETLVQLGYERQLRISNGLKGKILRHAMEKLN